MLIKNVKETAVLPLLLLLGDKANDPEMQKKGREHYGLSEDEQTVALEASVAGFIFDILAVAVQLPKAPLPRSAEKNRQLKLAEAFEQKGEAEIDDKYLLAIKDAMSNDAKWSNVKLTVSYLAGEEVKYDLLGCDALEVFPTIRQHLLSLFDAA